jgi:hypothetical protein
VEVLNAEDEKGVFSRVQTRGGRAAGKQWPAADEGSGRGGYLAVDVAELAIKGWWGPGGIEDGIAERPGDAVASGSGLGDHAFAA